MLSAGTNRKPYSKIDLANLARDILDLEYKSDLKRWTITELALKSNLSRTTIYFHLGADKSDYVRKAISILIEPWLSRELSFNFDPDQANRQLIGYILLFRENPALAILMSKSLALNDDYAKLFFELEKSIFRLVEESILEPTQIEIEIKSSIVLGLAFQRFQPDRSRLEDILNSRMKFVTK